MEIMSDEEYKYRKYVTDWFEVSVKLPPPSIKVLGWDVMRGSSIAEWIKREDVSDGSYWIVDGSSGGLGTPLEVKPPSIWALLPTFG